MTTLVGTDTNESFAGSFDSDCVSGLGGNDRIYAWDGNDTLYGGAGNDLIYSGSDHDLAFGSAGDDTVQGGSGADTLYGGAGDDSMVVNYASEASTATAYGGSGNDEVMFFGGAGGHAYGGGGLDLLTLLSVDGSALTVDLARQTLDGHGSFVGVTFAGFEALTIIADTGNDVIRAGDAGDDLEVKNGDNLVEAGVGDDLVSYITRGASTLDGGTGQDGLQVSGGTSSL